MPIAKFEMPDGRIAKFEVPEGTSPEDAQAQIEAMLAQQESQSAPPVDNFGDRTPSEAVAPRGGNDAIKVLGEFAQSINVGIPQLLDMPSHVVNWMLEKSGADVRLPATMERNFNKLPGGEGGFMAPGMARDAVRTAGQLTSAAAGLYPVQRAAGTAMNAASDILGFGSSIGPGSFRAAGEAVKDNLPVVRPGERAARADAQLPLLRQTGDAEAAGYRLNNSNKVVPDKVQQKAIERGVTDSTVSMTAAANQATKERMREMNQIVLRARQNGREGALTTPNSVVGKSINDRLGIIWDANKKAGAKIDEVAESQLKNKVVEVQPVINTFMDDLAKQDIIFDPNTGVIDFSNSTIEGLTDLQGIIKRVVKRLYSTKAPTAYDVHRAKRFLDEQVTYGKTQTGMSGRMEGIIKKLRSNLDGVLDQQFPDYDAANTAYADTVQILDDVQRLAGGDRVDLLGPRSNNALGKMSRKMISNYNNGDEMITRLNTMTDIAKKYQDMADFVPKTLDDDIVSLAVYDGELRSLFPKYAAPRNAFARESGADTIGMARDAMTGNMPGLMMSAFQKMAGKSPAALAKAEKALFKERLQLLNELTK